MGEASMMTAFLLVGLLILIQVVIIRWLFRINTIVQHMQFTNGLLIRMLQRQGASDEEIKDVLIIAEKDMKKLLNRPK